MPFACNGSVKQTYERMSTKRASRPHLILGYLREMTLNDKCEPGGIHSSSVVTLNC